jgi:DDE family transposase
MLDARQEGHRIVVTSKWNKIEYRRFSFITGNWRRQHSALIQISMSSSR